MILWDATFQRPHCERVVTKRFRPENLTEVWRMIADAAAAHALADEWRRTRVRYGE